MKYRRYGAEEYEKALKLRREGWLCRRISEELDIPESTIRSWWKGHKPLSVWPKDKKAESYRKRFTPEVRAKMGLVHIGQKFTPEAIMKLSVSKKGPLNPNWKGNEVTESAIRQRLQRNMPVPKGYDRHHVDGNGRNSDPSNVHILTRREHMIKDGRMFRRDKKGRFVPRSE